MRAARRSEVHPKVIEATAAPQGQSSFFPRNLLRIPTPRSLTDVAQNLRLMIAGRFPCPLEIPAILFIQSHLLKHFLGLASQTWRPGMKASFTYTQRRALCSKILSTNRKFSTASRPFLPVGFRTRRIGGKQFRVRKAQSAEVPVKGSRSPCVVKTQMF